MNDAFKVRDLQVAVSRYRFMALFTGSVLATMFFIGLPFKYILGHQDAWISYGWMAHGWIYMVYTLVTIDLGLKAKWSYKELILNILAGTIPVYTFVVEKRISNRYK
jgi:integral membrane protein